MKPQLFLYQNLSVLLGIFLLGGSLEAQTPDSAKSFLFESISLPEGNQAINMQDIAQDTYGFMWFATQLGLFQWDGYEYTTYLHDPEDSTSMASNYVECLFTGSEGNLWIGHLGAGLDRFDYATKSFHHFRLGHDSIQKSGVNNILSIAQDNQGQVWLATGNGVFRLDPKTGKNKRFSHQPSQPNSLIANYCSDLYFDSEGTLWVASGFPWNKGGKGGLNRYRPDTEDFERFQPELNNAQSLSHNKVTALLEDSKGRFWVGTDAGMLHLMDRRSGKFQQIRQFPNPSPQAIRPRNFDFNQLHIGFIKEDQDHMLWIGTVGGAISYFNPETGQARDFDFKANDPHSLPDSNPWAMMQSRDGTYWACTHGPKSHFFKFRESSFEYVPIANSSNMVYSFCETRDKKIWVGTEADGLYQFDPETRDLSPFSFSPIYEANLSTGPAPNPLEQENLLNYTLEMEEDPAGQVWIRKYLPKGLSRVDPKTGRVRLYRHDPEDSNSIANGRVSDILKDNEARIWAATVNGKLNLFDAINNSFFKYTLPTASSSNYHFYSKMASAADGKIWIASKLNSKNESLGRFWRLDPETALIVEFPSEFVDDPVFKRENIHKLTEDHAGNLWIMSNTKIKRFNPQNGKIDQWRSTELGARYFKGLNIDEQGRLWLMGDKIYLFDPKAKLKSSFIATYKLEASANFTAYTFKSENGSIYFGGRGGFQSIRPEKINHEDPKPPLESLIKDFQFLYQNEDVSRPQINILTTDYLNLSHDQNAFTFRFSALGFDHPESNRIEYKLEGYDVGWRSAKRDLAATYVKVPAGNYRFKVRSASLRGQWGPAKSIAIHIIPAWWASWWAYMLYAILGLSLLYAFYIFQLNLNLEKAEASRLQELDAIKTRLYTNITHEFRTPLTVISGMAEQMEKDSDKWLGKGIKMIKRNSNRLLELINQMLDLSKLESGKLALNLQQGDIIAHLSYLVESMHSLAESKEIRIHFYAEEEDLIMDFDREKLQQVMINLLSNAVKFSTLGGDVYVTARKIERSPQEASKNASSQLQITVRDTGPGIPESQIPYIFNRFYQIDDSSTRSNEGSGIGLALVKELVLLMSGEISVQSKLEKETSFTITLPIKNQAIPFDLGSYEPSPAENVDMRKPEHTNVIASSIRQQALNRTVILLIEDNADVVAYIASCLQDEYIIQVGKDGQEGIEIALSNIPDLIITDVMMPYKDGFEVCNTLKNDKRSSHIPIIMLTAKADLDSKLEGLEKGADAYLAKPFNEQELLIRIRKLLELRRELQQYYRALAISSEPESMAPDLAAESTEEAQFMRKLKQIVEEHLADSAFTVEQFCLEIGMSHSQLHRKMTALTGFSPNRFIRFVRLSRAKELLKKQDMPISSVAYDTGFNDPSYFGRMFKKEFAMTPLEWQAQLNKKS